MKIKKFKARNFTEALEQVKKELSEDAIILSTEEKKGLRPFVEVTAAIDYDMTRNIAPDFTAGESNVNHFISSADDGVDTPAPVHTYPQLHDNRWTEEIKNEIGNLRLIIESMKNNGYEISLPEKKRTALHFLRERSVMEEFALRLCGKAEDLDDIPSLIAADINVKEHTNDRRVVMLIGPTGVGKTTTIAKLSACAIKEGRRAAIINLDTYRIGAVEQMRIYSRIMGIPLSIASNAAELKNSLLKFAATRDIIFIDTTGRNPKDDAYINDMVNICRNAWSESSLPPMELNLLMSASSDDTFMIDAYRSYSRLPINYIAFTKVDEAVKFGSLYNLMLTYQRPVAFITTGQKVPDDINFVTADELARLILKKESCK